MNRYVKAMLAVLVSAVGFFFIARAYFASQMPALPVGNARYTQLLAEAQAALATARAIDYTLLFIVIALIAGIWWARRK